MKKISKKVWLSVLIYLGCLIAGTLCIYLVQWNQYHNLKRNAMRAAEELAAGEELESGYEHMHVSVYLYEDGTAEFLEGHTSIKYGDYEGLVLRFSSLAEDGEVHYLVVLMHSPLTFVAMACAPISEGQTVYMFYSIRYMASMFAAYCLACTIIFLIVIVYHRILQRKNEQVNAIYRCYVANVSHELKSPIASIRALTETLSAGLVEDEAERSRYYGMISREARNLEHAVQDIMELSRIQEHRIDFSCAEIHAEVLFGPVCRKYEELGEDMEFRFTADDSLFSLPALNTNADRITQLLEILLNNAVKFLDEEREGRIELFAECRAGKAIIHVRDNGIGIAPEDLPHVFERFFKSNLEHNPSGTGLGLAIAQEITQALGEEIAVTSRPGEGTEFTFTIRLVGKKALRKRMLQRKEE